MDERRRPHGRVPWVALLTVAVLAGGVLLAFAPQWQARLGGAPGDRVVERVLEGLPATAAEFDSAAFKHRWLDEVRGVDDSALDGPRREIFLRFANARDCTCGCGYSLAACKASDMTCEVSGAALTALRDSILAGAIASADGIRMRPPAP